MTDRAVTWCSGTSADITRVCMRVGQGEAVLAAMGGVDVDIVMPVVDAVDAYVIGAVRREIAERRRAGHPGWTR